VSDGRKQPFEPAVDTRPDDRPWSRLRWPVPADALLGGTHVEVGVADPHRDARPLFEALDHDAVWRHVAGRPAGPEGWRDRFAEAVDRGRVLWVVRLRTPVGGLPAGTLVGTSSYLDVSVDDARLEIGSTAYAPRVWGTVVNPEVKLVLLGYAYDELGAGRVQLKTDVRNVRSQRAIARLGATYEGTLRRYQRRSDQTVRDTAMFSIVAEEWPAVRDALRRRVAGG
jgi:RimJ/RimL family protein N-acetyltransferase